MEPSFWSGLKKKKRRKNKDPAVCFWVRPVTRHAPGRTAGKRLCSWQEGGGQGCVNDAHARTFSRVGCHLIQRKKKKKKLAGFRCLVADFYLTRRSLRQREAADVGSPSSPSRRRPLNRMKYLRRQFGVNSSSCHTATSSPLRQRSLLIFGRSIAAESTHNASNC